MGDKKACRAGGGVSFLEASWGAIFRLRPSPPLAYLLSFSVRLLLLEEGLSRGFYFSLAGAPGTVSLLGRRIGCGSWRLLRGLWCLFGHRDFGRRDAKMVMVVPEIAEACCACVFMRA